jgi:hypothetical protein
MCTALIGVPADNDGSVNANAGGERERQDEQQSNRFRSSHRMRPNG